MAASGWDGGMDAAYLRELCGYWKEGYNWRREEQKLNQLNHYRTEIDDVGIHFVSERGKGPAPFPLILTHGYPDSFYRFVKLIPLLTDPAAFGGRAEDLSMSWCRTFRATDSRIGPKKAGSHFVCASCGRV
jgi:hypothetical protein